MVFLIIIKRVSSRSLPGNVLGCYFPHSHTIYLRNDLPMKEEASTLHHEVGHAMGIVDEFRADGYSASQTGRIQRCLPLRRAF